MRLSLEQLIELEKILTWEIDGLNSDIKRSGSEYIVTEATKKKKLISPIRLKVRQQIRREQAKLNIGKK